MVLPRLCHRPAHPAACGACGFDAGRQYTFRTRGPLDAYDLEYQQVCTEHNGCAGIEDQNPNIRDIISCHSTTVSSEWTSSYYAPMPITIGPY